jgi:inorganic pyrophosphatase
MKISKMPSCFKGTVNVIIETPKGSQNKFDYDPEFDLFTLKKALPMGTVFPFDFGFIPNTKGEDGDPLDILVIMDQPAYPGCHVACRLLGVLTADQIEKNGKKLRNDRFVGVAECSVQYHSIKKIKELSTSMIEEIENFFVDYNKHQGKKFIPLKWKNPEKAIEMINDSQG